MGKFSNDPQQGVCLTQQKQQENNFQAPLTLNLRASSPTRHQSPSRAQVTLQQTHPQAQVIPPSQSTPQQFKPPRQLAPRRLHHQAQLTGQDTDTTTTPHQETVEEVLPSRQPSHEPQVTSQQPEAQLTPSRNDLHTPQPANLQAPLPPVKRTETISHSAATTPPKIPRVEVLCYCNKPANVWQCKDSAKQWYRLLFYNCHFRYGYNKCRYGRPLTEEEIIAYSDKCLNLPLI